MQETVITRLRHFSAWVRETIRHEGYLILAWRIFVKLVSPAVELDAQILFEFDLTQPIEQRSARVECTIEEATAVDTEELLEMRFPALPASEDSVDWASRFRGSSLEKSELTPAKSCLTPAETFCFPFDGCAPAFPSAAWPSGSAVFSLAWG